MHARKSLCVVAVICCTVTFWAQSPPAEPSAPAAGHGSFLVAYRTPKHITASSPEVFHSVTQTVLSFLAENKVTVVRDSERGTIETADLMSTESMLRLAREAGAADLLYVTVDRPATKWVNITLQCYDLAGKQLWQEEAANGNGDLSGKSGLKTATRKMSEKLRARLGQPCLVADALPAPTATAPGGKQ